MERCRDLHFTISREDYRFTSIRMTLKRALLVLCNEILNPGSSSLDAEEGSGWGSVAVACHTWITGIHGYNAIPWL